MSPRRLSTSPKGWLVGGTLGYNYQIGSWVCGIEGDFDWVDLKGTDASSSAAPPARPRTLGSRTVRGRVGYAFDRWLPYLTGGAAFGSVKAIGNAGGTAR